MPAGRPPHKPTEESRQKVRVLAGLGMVVDDIARVAGIGETALRKYYPKEMAKGRAEANVRVSQALFRSATKRENVIAQMFWLKNRAGWKDLATPASGEQGATSLRIEFVRAQPQLEAKTIDAAEVGNGHDKEGHRTFDVSFE
jgi:hypothetical protein